MLCSSVQSGLRCPAIDESGDDIIPAAGTGGVSSQSRTNAVLPVLGRHGGEVPGHRGLAGGGHFLIGLDEDVGGLDSILEGDNEAHVVSHGLGTLVRGNAPVDEVERCVDVVLAGVLVDAPVVLSAGAQALVGFIADAM